MDSSIEVSQVRRVPLRLDRWLALIEAARRRGRLETGYAPILRADERGGLRFVLGSDGRPLWHEFHEIAHPDYAGNIVLDLDEQGDCFVDLPTKKVSPVGGLKTVNKVSPPSIKKVSMAKQAAKKKTSQLIAHIKIIHADALGLPEQALVSFPSLTRIAYPKWEHAEARIKEIYYFLTLRKSHDQTRAITLDLTYTTQAKARVASEGAAVYIRRRLSQALKRQLKDKSDFWFALEESPTGNLHLHGLIGCSKRDFRKLREVLHSVNEYSTDVELSFKNRAVDIQSPTRAIGWIKYSSQDHANKSPEMRVGAPIKTRPLIQAARRLYEHERNFHNLECNGGAEGLH